MVFKTFCVLVLLTKVASALGGLKHDFTRYLKSSWLGSGSTIYAKFGPKDITKIARPSYGLSALKG